MSGYKAMKLDCKVVTSKQLIITLQTIDENKNKMKI